MCPPPPNTSLLPFEAKCPALQTKHPTFGTTASADRVATHPLQTQHPLPRLRRLLHPRPTKSRQNTETPVSDLIVSDYPRPYHASLAYNRNVILVIIVFAAHRLTSKP